MLITFMSEADADVIMFGEVGEQMLAVMGKDPLALEGIVTLEQLSLALKALRQAVELDRMAQSLGADCEDQKDDEPDAKRDPEIRFAQRAMPLLEMLQRSIKEKTPVTWQASGQKTRL